MSIEPLPNALAKAIENKVKKAVVHPYRFFTFINDWFIPEDERD